MRFSLSQVPYHTIAHRIGGTACEKTEWMTDKSLRCRVAAGLRASATLVSTAALVVGSATEAFSYDLASLSTIFAANAPPVGGGVNGSVTIAAHNLAQYQASLAARVGGTACEASEWTSSTALLCNLARGPSLNPPSTRHSTINIPYRSFLHPEA